MSAVEKKILEVTEVKYKRGADEQEKLKQLVLAIQDLGDDDWNALGTEAQKWFNSAADAINDKKDIPGFPDAEEEKPAGRRGSASKEEKEDKPAGRGSRAAKNDEPEQSADPKVGDKATITNKRGKEFTGEVIEIDEDLIVLEVDGEEVEINRDRIEKIVIEGAKKSSGRGSKAETKEDPAVAEPNEGDQIIAVTKRGKTVEGKVAEIEDGIIYLEDDTEVDPEKLESLKIVSGKAEAKAKEEKPAGRRGSASKEEKEDKPARASSAQNGGVSVTQRIRELVAEDFEADVDEISKQLKKEGLQFRDNTVELTFKEMHKVIQILRDAKKLK